MLGEATRSLPLRLSFTALTIGSGHGDQAVRHAALAPLAQRAPDGAAQGPRPQSGLAAPWGVARPAADPGLPRRNRARDEGRRPPDPGVCGDLTGARATEARAAALPLRSGAAGEG